ncbi:MAG: hypothetical protein ACFFB5_08225 [Promethearchaeota archaeon]
MSERKPHSNNNDKSERQPYNKESERWYPDLLIRNVNSFDQFIERIVWGKGPFWLRVGLVFAMFYIFYIFYVFQFVFNFMGYTITFGSMDPIELLIIGFVVLGLPTILITSFIWLRIWVRREYPHRITSITQKEIPRMEQRIISKGSVELTPDLPLSKLGPEISRRSNFDLNAVKSNLKVFKEAVDAKPPREFVTADIRFKLSSIQYRVQDMIFDQSNTDLVVRLIPYSGSMKEIKVRFNNNQIVMNGSLKQPNLPKVSLELKITGKPREPSWDDLWQEITITGDEKIITGIKQKSEISYRLSSLGTALVKVESPKKGEINLTITCNETREAITQAYTLITNLQSFFEISIY